MWISCEKFKYWIAPKCKILCWLKAEVFIKSASSDFGCRLKGLEVQSFSNNHLVRLQLLTFLVKPSCSIRA